MEFVFSLMTVLNLVLSVLIGKKSDTITITSLKEFEWVIFQLLILLKLSLIAFFCFKVKMSILLIVIVDSFLYQHYQNEME